MKQKGQNPENPKKNRVIGFKVLEEECIWMKARVVNFRTCDNAYDCYNCPFDKAMRKAMGLEPSRQREGGEPEWVGRLKRDYHGAVRPCRHALTGRISAPKICTMNYECYHCPYDQMLDDLDIGGLIEAPSYKLVSGYRMAQGFYYHMGHTWARFEHGGRARVGLDDFLVKLFGAARALDLPPLGAGLKQNQVGWTFGRNGHKAAVLAPVTGKVLAVNHKAKEHPEITHHNPYQEGWLFILEPEFPKRNLKGLYFEKESFTWMEHEAQALMGLMGADYQQLAATGGEAIDDVFGRFPDLGWEDLAKTFLKTGKV